MTQPPEIEVLRRRVAELEGRLEAAERELAEARELDVRRRVRYEHELSEAHRLAEERQRALVRARADLARLRRQPVVRVALAVIRRLRASLQRAHDARRRAAGRIRAALGGRARDPTSSVAERRRAILAALPPVPPQPAGRAAIVVVSRGGPERLDRARAALAATGWDGLEIAVATGERPVAEVVAGLPVDLLVLVHDDVQPLEPGWLRRLVAPLADPEVGAVGARLLRPSDLAVVHRGIEFAPGGGMPHPRSLTGDDESGGPADVPAVSDAVLAVRREALDAVGGLQPHDLGADGAIDLCLRLRAAGRRVVSEPTAVLIHEALSEAPGEERLPGDVPGLVDRWGPRLFREVFRDRLLGEHRWSSEPLRIAHAGSPEAPAADVVLVDDAALDPTTLPPGSVRVAVGRPDGRDGDFDLALDGPGDLAGLPERLLEWVDAPRVAVQIGPLTWELAAHWGETPFGRALARQLHHLGHPARVLVHGEQAEPAATRADVALHLLGVRVPEPRSGQVRALWIIATPDRVTAELVDRYHVAFVASDRFLEALRPRVRTPLVPLHQATDPERFRPEAGGPVHELLFVGNSRNVRRPILDDLAGTDRDLAVYGRGWTPELLDPRHLRGEWVPNDELNRYYAAAGIVLNDHWRDMRDEGFISNRVYDALASGALVISDAVDGMDEEFDGAVVTYRDRPALLEMVERYRSDAAAREERAARGRAAVLARHTFSHRAQTILETIRPLLDERPKTIVPAETRS